MIEPRRLLCVVVAALGPSLACDPQPGTEVDAAPAPLDASTVDAPSSALDGATPVDSGAVHDDADGAALVVDTGVMADVGPDGGPRVDVRLTTPWNGAAVFTSRPAFRVLPVVSSTVEVCRDVACTDVLATLVGLPPLTPSSDLPRGLLFARARSESGGAWSATFAFESFGPVGGTGAHATISDFDGDGFEDVVLAGATRTVVLHGSATGLSRAWTDERPATAVGDIDGDGRAELSVASTPWGIIAHDGTTRTFQSVMPLEGTVAVTCSTGLTRLGDVDCDGYADVGAVCDLAAGRTAVWLRGGPTGLDPQVMPLRTVATLSAVPRGGYDVDGDGCSEVVALSAELEGGPSGPGAPVMLSYDPFGVSTFPGDADGDGAVDIAGTAFTQAWTARHEPTTRWVRGPVTTLATRPGWAVGGRDVDGDGRTDFLLGVMASGSFVDAYLGTSVVRLGEIAVGATPVLADVNADGYADLIYLRSPGVVQILGGPDGLNLDSPTTIAVP